MTALLWQSAVLLLGAYFVGAFLGCLVRRTFFARTLAAPALAGAGASVPASPASVGSIVGAPASASGSTTVDRTRRFEEALTGKGSDTAGEASRSAASEMPAVRREADRTPSIPSPPASQPSRTDQPVSPPAREPAIATPAAATAASVAAAAASAAATAATPARTSPVPAQEPSAPTTIMPVARGGEGPGIASAPIAVPTMPMPAQPETTTVEIRSSDEPQDLTRIRAIDSDLQGRLYDLGVTSYDAISGWKPGDVARIAAALKLPGRIEQENWIEQAQILAKGGETYYSRRKMRGELASSRPSPNEGERITVRVPAAWRQLPPSDGVSAVAVAATASDQAQSTVGTMAAESPAAAAVGTGRDQLQRIGGINAEVERLLNVQGVTRFAQIAEWSAADIARFDRLMGFEGRVARENWIDQSKVLANGGETAFSRAMSHRLATPPSVATAQDQADTGAARVPADKSGLRSDIGSLRSVRSEAYRADDADPAGSAPGRANDDLKRIRGVGVLIEKRLNGLGVSRYEQIANWTAADIERFSDKLDFRGRIERENWVEQARILSAGGQTEFSRRVDRGDL